MYVCILFFSSYQYNVKDSWLIDLIKINLTLVNTLVSFYIFIIYRKFNMVEYRYQNTSRNFQDLLLFNLVKQIFYILDIWK